MSATDDSLLERVKTHLKGKYSKVTVSSGEVTLEVTPDNYLELCQTLQTHQAFLFEQLIDLCAVDYSEFPKKMPNKFAVVLHLISYQHNERIRVRVFASDDELPILPTISKIWRGAIWFEREAFDLFGILFTEHPDLRRILTDYGFIGHPFRKDFPMVGHVQMRYDPKQKRVIYEPVDIKQRVVVPKTVNN